MKEIDDYLNLCLSIVTPSKDERSRASLHRGEIEACLIARLSAFRIFETGSWSHGTAVSPWSDVDYFVSLSGTRPRESLPDLTTVRDALRLGLAGATAYINRPAVSVRSHDGPDVEIVPAHVAGDDDYFIPEPNGTGWIKSSPLKHNACVDTSRDRTPQTKQFIRLIKEWKYQQNVQISSLYLEMRASKHVLDHPPFIMSMDLSWFLRDLHRDGLAAMNDPSRFDGRRIQPVQKPGQLANAKASVELAHKASSLAEDCRKAGNGPLAVEAWQILFDP